MRRRLGRYLGRGDEWVMAQTSMDLEDLIQCRKFTLETKLGFDGDEVGEIYINYQVRNFVPVSNMGDQIY